MCFCPSKHYSTFELVFCIYTENGERRYVQMIMKFHETLPINQSLWFHYEMLANPSLEHTLSVTYSLQLNLLKIVPTLGPWQYGPCQNVSLPECGYVLVVVGGAAAVWLFRRLILGELWTKLYILCLKIEINLKLTNYFVKECFLSNLCWFSSPNLYNSISQDQNYFNFTTHFIENKLYWSFLWIYMFCSVLSGTF